MPEPIHQSRRRLLKMLSGAPMLPLASASSAAAILGACSSNGSAGAASRHGKFVSAEFIGMPAPSAADAAAMATTTVGSALQVAYADGTKDTFKMAYHPFFVTGDLVPDGKGGRLLAGGYYDINHQPIVDRSVAGRERQFFSDSPDGTSLLQLGNPAVAGLKGMAVFAVVQFEYTTADQAGGDTYARLPSPIAVLTLDQDPATGRLDLAKYHNVDTSGAHGLWITCGASLSPWNTHLSSEEYEPDAQFISSNAAFKAFSKNLFGDESTANPYHYGHLPEVTVNPDGTGSVTKHYCLGRLSHELVQVMPDQRTVIMGDDATNSGLFMFIADREKDLSAGTLYVAHYAPGFSTDPTAPGASLSWIRIGHATSAEIEHLADTLKPADIMSVSLSDPKDSSYTRIFANGATNWIKIKPGMEKAAAFLETHRYAYLAGASMGFTKLEGTTVNIKDKVAYSALQNIQDSMVVNGKGWNAASNIALSRPLLAGGVMAHALQGGQKDTSGAAIDSEWVASRTTMLLTGEDIAADALGNKSNPDKVGNPDNLKFSEKLRTLFIGEDSSSHVNNFLWAYNIDTKQLARLMSVPAGAESTGLHAVDELNGWTYIMSNFQHPGDWGGIHSKALRAELDPLLKANYHGKFGAAVGYLTGFQV